MVDYISGGGEGTGGRNFDSSQWDSGRGVIGASCWQLGGTDGQDGPKEASPPQYSGLLQDNNSNAGTPPCREITGIWQGPY